MTTQLTPEQYEERIRELEAQNAQLYTANQELEQANRSLSIFFDRSTELLSIITFDGIFKVISPGWTKLLGFSEDEILNHSFVEFLHPDDIEKSYEVVQHLKQGTEVFAFENRYRTKDGSYVSLLWNVASDLETETLFLFTRDVTHQKEIERQHALYIETIQQLPYAVSIYEALDLDDINQLILRGHNALAQAILPHQTELLGKSMLELFPGTNEDPEFVKKFGVVLRSQQSISIERPYVDNDIQGFFNMTIFPLPNNHLGVIYEEVSERKRTEEALRQAMLQEEIINAQKAALEELSTPLIPISDSIMVMPLIGTMDTRRAQQVMDTILHGMSSTGSQFLIIDITGVNLIDTQVANSFIRAAQATKLLGAQVMLTGIRPEVAQTMVGLGIDLSSIITCSSLQRGIALANSMEKQK